MSSRKIAILLTLSATAVIATLLPILLLESQRTPDWQSSLREYLQVSHIPATNIQLTWVAEAQHVDRFPADDLVAVPTEWVWQSVDIAPPPDRVRCIRFERRGEWKTAQRIPDEHLVLGHHDDGLYHVGWIVYTFQPTVSLEEREELFARLGCDQWERVSLAPR
jgi:hypothetical protein